MLCTYGILFLFSQYIKQNIHNISYFKLDLIKSSSKAMYCIVENMQFNKGGMPFVVQ